MSILNGFLPIALDSEGRTIPNARLYTYNVGTYNLKDTYSNVGLTIPNSNPVVADGSGVFYNVYLGAGGYKLELRDENDVVIATQDNYYSNLTGADLANIDADIAAVSQQLSQTFLACTDSGAADAYVLAPVGVETAPTAYADGMIITFKPANSNTGASTVNVSGLGLKNLVTSTGAPLPASFLQTTKLYQFVYAFGVFVFYFHSGQLQDEDFPDSIITNRMIVDATIDKVKLKNDTAYSMLGYDSGGVATTFNNPLRLLADTAATATANIDFVLSTLDTQNVRNSYLIHILGIQPSADDKELYMTLSTDAGATWAATNYDYALNGLDTAAARTNSAAAAAQITIAGVGATAGKALSNAANEFCSAWIWIDNINTNSTLCPQISWTTTYYNADSQYGRFSGGATRSTAGDYDAIRFSLESAGNFAASGRIMLYKVCNSLS